MPDTTTPADNELDRILEEAALTPPQYRTSPWVGGGVAGRVALPPALPGPAIAGANTELVVLRGRPVGSEQEWTTWQEVDLSREDPSTVVAWFTERLPQYEFRVVRARRVYSEDVLA
jgi:hypothetical protein